MRVVVFDVDGTLYNQRRLRFRMLRRLITSAVVTGTFEDLRILHEFRCSREELSRIAAEDFLTEQYRIPAQRRKVSSERVEQLVRYWMEEQPLQHLRLCRYAGIEQVFQALSRLGTKIAVFSDYPARAKLAAMGLRADLVVSACDADVLRLKPHPRGLQKILDQVRAGPRECLMIGDRFDRDAEAAARMGVRALIRAARPHVSFDTFETYADDPFSALIHPEGPAHVKIAREQ